MGGKARISPWICQKIFEIKHRIFVDVFGGAGNVAFTYLVMGGLADVVVYNDKDNDVVNFFQCLRNKPKELTEAIRLTPYARAEHKLAYIVSSEDSDIEKARKYYIRSWQSFASTPGRLDVMQGWRSDKRARGGKGHMSGNRVSEEFYRLDVIERTANLLKKVQIECLDYKELIKQYDGSDALFYIDSPYLKSVRNRREHKAYVHEFELSDHEEMASILNSIQGEVVVSHKPCEEYDTFYDGWKIFQRSTQNNSRKQSHSEKIYIKPGAVIQERLL